MSQIRGEVITLLPITVAATGTATQIFQWGAGPMDYADFYLNVTTASGPTTLDVYLQTSYNAGLNWVDFLHFNTVTTTTPIIYSAQWARKATTVSSVAAVIPTGDANLNAAKVISGPLVDSQLRIKYVVAATTSYTFQVFAIDDRDV